MTAEELRPAIKALLTSHPALATSSYGHAEHAERYISQNAAPIGFEPERVRFQNLLVREDSVTLSRLAGVKCRRYDHTAFGKSKPNHDLFGEPAFQGADLVCFKVTDLWQAVRVIAEVAGLAARP